MQSSGPRRGVSKRASKAELPSVSEVLETVYNSLENSKAENVVTIDIQEKSALGDHMIVASGRSQRHVSAISDHLLRALKKAGAGSAKVEGLQSADWVLIDTGDIIVHIFRPEVREFYGLEKMWMIPAGEGEST